MAHIHREKKVKKKWNVKTKLWNTKASLHRVFVHCINKNKIFIQFHQNKFRTVLIKTIFYLRIGNANREFIGTCKYTVLKRSPHEDVKSRRCAAQAVLGIV